MGYAEKLKKAIQESEKIVFLGGAGVSTESGIPDFRSEDGLYSAKKQFGAPPEELLSAHFFKEHTDVFYQYYRQNLIHRDARPNAAHNALAKLEKIGKLKAVVTQNIDGLHQQAGSKNVLELHGSVLNNYCVDCHKQFDVDYIMDTENDVRHVPACYECGSVVRPDVVLYEEMLNENIIEQAVEEISNADMLIVGGTSLVVYPAAGMIDYFGGKMLVLINKGATAYDNSADIAIHDSIGRVLEAATEGF